MWMYVQLFIYIYIWVITGQNLHTVVSIRYTKCYFEAQRNEKDTLGILFRCLWSVTQWYVCLRISSVQFSFLSLKFSAGTAFLCIEHCSCTDSGWQNLVEHFKVVSGSNPQRLLINNWITACLHQREFWRQSRLQFGSVNFLILKNNDLI